MKIFNKTYDNGLRLCLEKNDSVVLSLNILFNVGSQNEQEHEQGYSHFIEHLIFKSSEKYQTDEINDKLSFYGADFNAYTTRSVTRFTFKCLAENFEPCFEIYSDILLRSKFEASEIDKERNVVVEEMKKSEDDPTQIMFERVMQNYYSGLSFAHDELGKEDVIMTVSREKLLAYKTKYYKPENCIISVAGNIDFDKLDKIVTKHFSSNFDYKHKPYMVEKTRLKENIETKFDIIERNDNQANVCILIKNVQCYDKAKYISDIYTMMLGASQNSRLFNRIREKLGLVYNIYAMGNVGAQNGEIFIMFGTRSKNISKAMREIKNVIDDLAINGTTVEELTRIKNLAKSSLSFNLETNSDIAEINGSSVHFYERVLTKDEMLSEIDKVSVEDINAFAKRIKEEKSVAVVAVGKGIKQEDIEVF